MHNCSFCKYFILVIIVSKEILCVISKDFRGDTVIYSTNYKKKKLNVELQILQACLYN